MTNEWMAQAKCREVAPEMFFPSDGAGVVHAQRVCATCEVAEACLEYALEHQLEHGVWGGKSERERRRLLKARRAHASVQLRSRWLPSYRAETASA